MNKFAQHILNEVFCYYNSPTLLTEAALADDIYTKYYEDKIDHSTFMKLAQMDPTAKRTPKGLTKGALLPWLVERWITENMEVDTLELSQALDTFVKLSKCSPELCPQDFNRNIKWYSSLASFISMMNEMEEEYEELYYRKRGTEQIGNTGFYIIPDLCEVIHKGKYWTVISPTCKKGGQYYGRGTEWCTAFTGNEHTDYYHDYLNRYGGKYYIIFNNDTGDRWQFHFENGDEGMFMDSDDFEVTRWSQMSHWDEELLELKQVFYQLYPNKYNEYYESNDIIAGSVNYDNYEFEEFLLSNAWDGSLSSIEDSIWGYPNSPVSIKPFIGNDSVNTWIAEYQSGRYPQYFMLWEGENGYQELSSPNYLQWENPVTKEFEYLFDSVKYDLVITDINFNSLYTLYFFPSNVDFAKRLINISIPHKSQDNLIISVDNMPMLAAIYTFYKYNYNGYLTAYHTSALQYSDEPTIFPQINTQGTHLYATFDNQPTLYEFDGDTVAAKIAGILKQNNIDYNQLSESELIQVIENYIGNEIYDIIQQSSQEIMKI